MKARIKNSIIQRKEINFDGLVGPTHNYAGLAFGNVASLKHKHCIAHPKQAALQGLAKMKAMMDLGIPQAILPPHERPALHVLRAKGYQGSVAQILDKAWRDDRELLVACCSASAMWTANAATVAPAQDTLDQKLHITPANLLTQYHRSIETATTTTLLRRIFANQQFFHVHEALPALAEFADEGAANHTRLADCHSDDGLHVFVYGIQRSGKKCFPARQTLQASQRIAAMHQLRPEQVVYVEQNPGAIDAGVFHNDVIAVGNESVFMYHEDAYVNEGAAMAELQQKYHSLHQRDLTMIRVSRDALPLEDAVQTYLFNSQIVSLARLSHQPSTTSSNTGTRNALPGSANLQGVNPATSAKLRQSLTHTQSSSSRDEVGGITGLASTHATHSGSMVLIAPHECQNNEYAACVIAEIIADKRNPIDAVQYLNLRQSMCNGGGPACLRLRVVLSEAECAAINGSLFVDKKSYKEIAALIDAYYRDDLVLEDLRDPLLYEESCLLLDALSQLLGLGNVYDFQW